MHYTDGWITQQHNLFLPISPRWDMNKDAMRGCLGPLQCFIDRRNSQHGDTKGVTQTSRATTTPSGINVDGLGRSVLCIRVGEGAVGGGGG